jgi:RNA polymerase sigma-70 factor
VAPSGTTSNDLFAGSEPLIDELYLACVANAPNFGVDSDCFANSVRATAEKFAAAGATAPTQAELDEFIRSLQADDLFLAIACANGNERAWWEFDQQHRSYMERVARHLAKTDVDAQEVIDAVYVELYGTRVVDGERMSKFATYSGRGSLRGWLRTVIWHSIVDLHRAGHDEVSLDEMTETVGEGAAQASFANPASGGEDEMIDQITRDRYRAATLSSLGSAFGSLDDHEKLLLLYYHCENMKLREIARLVENEGSPLRAWFQRRSANRDKNPESRIHESTVMRWLEKCYAKVLQQFRSQLESSHGLNDKEIEICMDLAQQDLSGQNIYRNLSPA